MSAHPEPPEASEPNTPMWLPALGAMLFALAGVWWATRPVPPSIVADTTADAGTQGAPSPVAVNTAPAPGPAQPHLPPGGGGRPGPDVRSARPQPDPAKAGDIQRMLNRIPKQR